MDIYKKFKPNLIPNSSVSDPINLEELIGEDIKDYIITYKKDGCRMELVDGKILTRALKPVTSLWVRERYQKLAGVCKSLGIILEGEFYSHGMRFPEIVRYFKTEDVRDEKNIRALQKLEEKGLLEQEWPGRTVAELSTYPESLKFYPFDMLEVGNPDIPYSSRIEYLKKLFSPEGSLAEFADLVSFDGCYFTLTEFSELQPLYEKALDLGYEGLVLAHKDRTYKFNRSTAKEKTLFKMKEDKNEYDGKVLDILEGTVVDELAPKTVNELGRSVTSKLQEDRLPSGMASCILTEFEGHPIKVSFEGYTHSELADILKNKDQYIGKWFKYTGMAPTKNVPRHAHCSRNPWRDDK